MITRSVAAGRARYTCDRLVGSSVCAVSIEDALAALEGVRAVRAYPRTGSIVVWHHEHVTQPDLLDAIARAFEAPILPVTRAPWSSEASSAELVRIGVGGVVLIALGFRRLVLRRPALLGPRGRTVATVVTIFSGYPFLRGAVATLSGRRAAGTDALVSAATVASLLLRENVVALTVLWLLNIGEYLQELTLRRTRRAIRDLLTGTQTTVWALAADGVEALVDIDRLQVGDLVVIHEQVALPIDGVVVDGEGIIDRSALTGETMPASIDTGDSVLAGSVLMRGRLVVRATAVGHETAIGRIIARVEHAQLDRAPIQTVGEAFSRRFVPASFALAAATFAITRDPRRAMTMLLVACPCAVGLSTPTAISAAIGNGARRGILVKGGSHLEAASAVDVVVFDKTGTLTTGRPVVTNVISFDPDWEPEDVLAHVASSEIHSRHPLAQAVIRSTEERRIHIPPHEECEVLLGLGMRTRSDGHTWLLGSLALLRREGVEVSAEALIWTSRLQQAAETPMLFAVDTHLVGLVSVRDTVRPEAADVIAALRAGGVERIVMLTGDHPDTAAAVAVELGITEWRSEVRPEDKQDVVHALQLHGHRVAMIGDGTNDAPALAAADVGVAMGLSGTDVAVETADIALVGDDLHAVVDLLDLSGATVRIVRQNYGMSIAVNSVGLFAGAAGALSPVLAAVLHNASSLAVVANSARMTRYRLD